MSASKQLTNRRRFLTGLGEAALMVSASSIGRAVAASGDLPGPDASPGEVCASYWRAMSSRNLELTLQHYLPNAAFVAAGVEYRGADRIRESFTKSFYNFPQLEVGPVHAISCGSEAAIEFRAVLTDRSGAQKVVLGVNVMQIEAGRFAELRAYFDPAALSR